MDRIRLQKLRTELSSLVLDKQREVDLCLMTIMARGHLLIEDVPGVGKTTLVQALAYLLGLPFSRVQGTSDLLPGDILGNMVYNNKKSEFEFHPGAIFNNVVLADELNRMNPRTQSALLQAMEEYEVSIEGRAHPLPIPFFVIATQNPQSQTGTFPLPESQLDRFMASLRLLPPSKESEQKLIEGFDPRSELKKKVPLFSPLEVAELIRETEKITLSSSVSDYITHLLQESRSRSAGAGLSTRAGISLGRMAKARALLQNQPGVLIEDVQYVAPAVFAHRLGGERGVDHGLGLAEQLVQKTPVAV